MKLARVHLRRVTRTFVYIIYTYIYKTVFWLAVPQHCGFYVTAGAVYRGRPHDIWPTSGRCSPGIDIVRAVPLKCRIISSPRRMFEGIYGGSVRAISRYRHGTSRDLLLYMYVYACDRRESEIILVRVLYLKHMWWIWMLVEQEWLNVIWLSSQIGKLFLLHSLLNYLSLLKKNCLFANWTILIYLVLF